MGKFIRGDARKILTEMAEQSVHACITSPPYWGLRDYKTPKVLFSDGWRGQFGLEPTPEMYVGHTLEFLRAIRRVLRDDGVCFWVIGDSYAGSGGDHKPHHERHAPTAQHEAGSMAKQNIPGLKPKDLVMIPFRVALAAQADGWWVRSVIIWSKPNPMPESVRDRPTTAHEYVLLLTKSARYFYDADAIREPHRPSTLKRIECGLDHQHPDDIGIGIPPVHTERMGERFANPSGRNKRTVWEIATQPYGGPHYATFPTKLVEPMILTTPTKVCAECGAGWERVIEREKHPTRDAEAQRHKSVLQTGRTDGKTPGPSGMVDTTRTIGFRPTCSCNAGETKAVILDPFCGTGTTCWQARKLGRDWIGIDIDPKSIKMARQRMKEG